ncbi:Gfo/Idh/MocA family oxidoreductase, partial [Planktotalea sp.]|uniref:Gfo/Idh/MocA family protein n=1 Tax=Planktotalea sp. TaxID=2029877 RepID=UPI00329A05D9
MNKKLSVAVIGLGYFSQFHLKAWRELDSVKRIHVTDLDQERVRWAENSFDAVGHSDVDTLFHGAAVDVVDIIAPPSAHLELIRKVAHANRTIICQKPFCTSIEEAEKAIALAEAHGARLVIHENFRFQPWYRAIKTILDDGQLGQIYQCRFALRPGDGQGADAYLARQPSFRGMPRFLV